MAFDLSTAKPIAVSRAIPDAAPNGGGFDLSTARPANETAAARFDRNLPGYGEAALSLITGATGGLLGRVGGTLGGLAANITSGKYGTQEGAQMAGEVAAEAQHRLTYEPRTEEGKSALAAIGKLFETSKLEGLGPIALPATAAVSEATQAARQPVRVAVTNAATAAKQGIRDFGSEIRGPTAEMSGMGAANTEQSAIRQQRASSLPVPIQLTKGQATRDFAQQQFEREAAKNPAAGEPLRQHYADQNQKILQNFDTWIDQTGAEAGSLRATGESVTQAIATKANNAKSQIRSAYERARESGAMQEKIDVSPLRKYLDDHQAEAINAPVLSSVEAKLQRVADTGGAATINDLEELRKMVGTLSGKDATNAHYGKEVKGVIDGLTEGRGGDLYKMARSLRSRYGREFEDHAVIDKLLSFHPGTKDRAVAYEDVFAHSILRGSLDDVRTMRRTLQTASRGGEQAWRELQGATLQHIRDEITKNVQIDATGNRVLSPARLDRLVTELDKDGKLDFIFGKQGAQQIRDVNGIAQDAFTAPPGSVNQSNTASILLSVLDKVASKTSGVPFLGSALKYGAGEVKNAGIRGKVAEALRQ